MTDTATAYPLTWPPRFTRAASRESGSFKTSLAGALKNVDDSLRRFSADSSKKIEGLVISSNVALGVSNPKDPGVAVWFRWDGLQVCIAVDRYTKVESNLQAIHHIIEARRTELRHGTLALVRATFEGFKALPSPADSGWRSVLGFDAVNAPVPTRDLIDLAYRDRAKAAHPDVGGSQERMTELNAARAAALKEIGA